MRIFNLHCMFERHVLTFIILFLSNASLLADSLRGSIIDRNTHEPVIGATISLGTVKSNKILAVTDANGNFQINIGEYPAKLIVSYVGYNSEEYAVAQHTNQNIDISLTESTKALNEVVVVGYGTQSRTQLTGAVTTIKADALAASVAPTINAALVGKVAGLNVTAASGQPGAESSIRIRGGNSVNASNEPLYVVDGFIYFHDAANSSTGISGIESSLNPLATINPTDIESVEVLKDVSATAIYGSRGANGVILITTRKGSKQKPIINYSFRIGVSNVTKKLDLLNASQWAQYQKSYWGNKGGYSDEAISALGSGTNWQDAVLRTAMQQSHEISVTGATESSRYAFSANYTNQDGVILNSGFQRYNFHTNVEWSLSDKLKFGVNATYGRSKQEGLTTTSETVYNSSPYSAGITNSFVYALLMPPVISVYNADGSYNFTNPFEYAYFAIGNHAANPLYDLKESVAENINNYLLSNIWATYDFGPFTLKALLGLSSEKLTQNYFAGAYTALGLATQGIGGVGNRQTDVWQQEYTINYHTDLGLAHHIDALAGYTRQNSVSTFNSIRTSHYTNETLKQYNLGDGSSIYTPQSGKSESSLNSLIARVNYTFLKRYNATTTLRADNSSRFAAHHRWGYFPSLGLSWNIDREPFLQGKLSWLDNLKLRVSGGMVGNQEISDYNFSTSYSTGSYNGTSSYAKSTNVNDNLKWETTASYNIGLDAGLFDERLNIVLDAYYKKTSDLLLNVPAGFSSGVTTQLQNVGNVVNRGIELTLDGTLIKHRNISWTANATFATNHNEITSMGTASDIILGDANQQILRKGESLGSFYGLQFAGIVQKGDDVSKLPTINGKTPSAGDAIFVDTNHDHKIDVNDRVVLGSIQPAFTYGFGSQLKWNRFDASIAFSGSYGNKLYNALGRRLEQTGDSYNVLTTILNAWTPENASNTLALPSTTRPFSYIDSRYVQSASYLKLRNLTIGYQLPLPKDFHAKIRIALTGSNLLTFSPYKGFDPEVASGTDNGAYPASRNLVLSANITF